MGFVDWMKTEQGVSILSFIWGLGIAFIFYQECKGSDCIIIKSPNVTDMQNKTYSYKGNENECYRFEPHFVPCK